jgi:Rrf2 family protein
MTLFTSKVDYALRALLDLAQQVPGRAVQSREIAARQEIPEAYLNQLLVILRRAGLVRSIRGAAGGYVLGRPLREIRISDVVCAFHGEACLGCPDGDGPATGSAIWVVRDLRRRVDAAVRRVLEETTLADLVEEQRRLDEAQSLMLGI